MDQPNTGSFGSAMGAGVGPALSRAIQQNSGALNQNSQSPQAIIPPSSPSTGSAVPANLPQQAPQQGAMPATASDLQIALKALAGYVASHGAVHEAQNDVPLKKAQASALTQGGQ